MSLRGRRRMRWRSGRRGGMEGREGGREEGV
jgi:hypothetical protein